MQNIPFLDLEKQYISIKDDIDKAIMSVVNDRTFIRGPHVEKFEKEFAELHNCKHSLGVGNGTDALFIALKVLGVGEGDEVITVANSFIATSEAITMVGAKVVFCDCEPDTYCISTSDIREKITANTKAIIPVHLYGQMAKMDEIKAIADEFNLKLIEDASQAVLAELNEQSIGSFGDCATVSFYPGKNLGAFGDAGAILTNNTELFLQSKKYANHGRINKYDHEFEGINSRMDGIQGAVLSVKLKHIEEWTVLRIKVASIYNKELKDCKEIHLPIELNNFKHVYHVYSIRVNKEERDNLLDYLRNNGVSVGVHYPIALPSLEAYKYLEHTESDFPNANRIANELISLPIYPEMNEEQVKYIAELIFTYFKKY